MRHKGWHFERYCVLSVYNESLNQRKDLPKNSYSTDDIEECSEKKSDFFVVPKVVEWAFSKFNLTGTLKV